MVVERCPVCRRNPTPQRAFLPKANYDLEKLPIFENLAKDAPKCDVKGCINIGVEYHHYAPRHLFDNADDWLTGWLCKQHHAEWHKKTRTGSYYRKEK